MLDGALLLRTAALFAAGSAIGLIVNAARPTSIPLALHQPVMACEGAPTPVEELGPEEAQRLCGEAKVLVADARPAKRFESGHIAGALHLPCTGSLPDALRDGHGASGTVVVYGDTTEEARPVAESLRARLAGHARVAILRGGFAAWERAGLACSSGVCAHCGGKEHHGP